jgi:hypothetical protein
MTITMHNKQRRCSVGRPYSIKLFSIADLKKSEGKKNTDDFVSLLFLLSSKSVLYTEISAVPYVQPPPPIPDTDLT